MTTIYVAMRNVLYVVDDATGDPSTLTRLEDRDLECVLVHPEAPEHVLVGTFESGLHRSTDGGGSFERVEGEVEQDAVTSLAANPDDPSDLWLGTEPSRVYRSDDGGETWTEREGLTDLASASRWSFPPRPHTHHVRWLEVDPGDSEHIYVGVEAGALVQTRDGGETWEDRRSSSRRDNHTLATHPDVPERVWSAAGDGYAESRDAGETWQHPQEGLKHRYCWSVAVDPGDPETVLLSAASGARTAHTPGRAESYVYRKRGEEPWERLGVDGADSALPTGEGVVRALLEPGAEAGELFAATNRGLYRTTDAGDSWTPLDVDWPESFESQTPRGLAVVPE